MKINGIEIKPIFEEVIRITEDISFTASAITNEEEFEILCPDPKPPMIHKKGMDEPTPDFKSEKYIEAQAKWVNRRKDWIILRSLKDVEWETVDMNEPDTWCNWEKELKEAGFPTAAMSKIIHGVMKANCLSDDLISAAEKDFLPGPLEAKTKESGLQDEQ